jgi:type VI protein secretion system component VasK
MNTIRIILPALLTIAFSLSFLWLIVYFIKQQISDKDVKALVTKIARIIMILILFCNTWWIVSLLSVNEIPRSKQDRTLNSQMRDNFQDRMEKDLKKKDESKK